MDCGALDVTPHQTDRLARSTPIAGNLKYHNIRSVNGWPGRLT